MTTVVVPLDGSALAAAALRPGAALAVSLGGDVLAVMARERDDGQPLSETDEHLAEAVASIAPVVSTRSRVIDGDPADAIAGAVAEETAGVVCMSTHGRGGLARLVMGSVADAVLERCAAPIVLVGDECRTVPVVGEQLRVVVCHDGSEASEAVVPVAAWLARRGGAALRIVEVVPPDENVPDEDSVDNLPGESAEVMRALRRLDGVRARLVRAAIDIAGNGNDRLASDELDVDLAALHGADVARAVDRFGDRVGANLVALATHGSTGVRRLALGSVALEVVRRSRTPVLLVRSGVE